MLKNGSLIVKGSSKNSRTLATVRNAEWALKAGLKVPEGMFVCESYNGYRWFGQLTGKSTRRWSMDMPLVHLFQVETVVLDGSIWGVVGDRSTHKMTYTRSENVVDIPK